MKIIVFIGIGLAFFAIMMWRKSSVIEAASDAELMKELKRRAYARKMKAEADAEVENAIKADIDRVTY